MQRYYLANDSLEIGLSAEHLGMARDPRDSQLPAINLHCNRYPSPRSDIENHAEVCPEPPLGTHICSKPSVWTDMRVYGQIFFSPAAVG